MHIDKDQMCSRWLQHDTKHRTREREERVRRSPGREGHTEVHVAAIQSSMARASRERLSMLPSADEDLVACVGLCARCDGGSPCCEFSVGPNNGL